MVKILKDFFSVGDKTAFSPSYQKDHFVRSNGKLFAGYHYLIDVWGRGIYLENELEIRKILKKAATSAGASVLHILTHRFGDGQGITGIAILAESHISVHTWPERDFAAFDIFLCGDTNPEKSLEIIKQYTKASKLKVSKIKRGIIRNKKF